MRHRKAVLKLNKTPSHRKAMFRNMVTSLFKYERIQTTGAKAKEVRRWADNLITLAKRGDLHARRQALAIVREKDVVHKLFEHAAERYGSVSGGYTRIVKLGHRPGDAAPVSLVELVFSQDTKKKKTKKKKAKADAAPKKAADTAKPAVDEGKPKAKKTKAIAKDDTGKSAAKKLSKKKAAGDEKEEKSVTKAAPKKKATAADKPAADAKEAKPLKEAKAAAPKEAAGDTKKKQAAAKKAPKDK
jgi:large subunit ribosomal protein L17